MIAFNYFYTVVRLSELRLIYYCYQLIFVTFNLVQYSILIESCYLWIGKIFRRYIVGEYKESLIFFIARSQKLIWSSYFWNVSYTSIILRLNVPYIDFPWRLVEFLILIWRIYSCWCFSVNFILVDSFFIFLQEVHSF